MRIEKAGVLVRPMITAPAPFEIGDDRAVGGRDVVAKGDDAVVGGAAGLVGVDLYRDRHSVQRSQDLPPRLRLIGRARGGERLLLEHTHHRVDRRVYGVEAREAGLPPPPGSRYCRAGSAAPAPSHPAARGRRLMSAP